MDKMAITPKGLKLMLVGLILMILGYVLMSGGGMQDPQQFNYDMFDWRRLVLAPIVILGGIVVIAIGIIGNFKNKKQ